MSDLTQCAAYAAQVDLRKAAPLAYGTTAPRVLTYLAFLCEARRTQSPRRAAYATPRVTTIAARLGRSRRAIQYALRRLEGLGYLKTQGRWPKGRHRQTSNLYRPGRRMWSIFKRLQAAASAEGGGRKPLRTDSHRDQGHMAGPPLGAARPGQNVRAPPADSSSGGASDALAAIRRRLGL